MSPILSSLSKWRAARPRPATAPADRIPPAAKAGYAAGVGADTFGIQAVADKLWLPFLNIGLGLNPALAATLLMLFRLIEAFLSPLVGTWSDNTRTRLGRRRPWILVGAALMAIAYPLMFLPDRNWGQTDAAIHFAAFSTLFVIAYVMWSVPYFSLGLELTPDYDERTRLGAWTALGAKIFGIPAGWILLFVSGPLFVDAVTGKPDIVAGVQTYSLIAAPAILLFGALPALLVRERYYQGEVAGQPRVGIWHSLKESARCRPLWPLILSSAFLVMGFTSLRSLGVYVNIYYVFGGDIAAATALEGVKFTVTFVIGILSLPLLARLSERYDKRTVTIGLVLIGILAQMSNLVLMRPDMPYLQIIPAIFAAGLVSSVWMFVPSMKADVADHDELQSGFRREGSLNALYTWFFKLALVTSAGLGGAILQLSGFDVSRDVQPPEVLRQMLLCFALLPALIWGLCILAFLFYRLDRSRLADIRRELEARRGAI